MMECREAIIEIVINLHYRKWEFLAWYNECCASVGWQQRRKCLVFKKQSNRLDGMLLAFRSLDLDLCGPSFRAPRAFVVRSPRRLPSSIRLDCVVAEASQEKPNWAHWTLVVQFPNWNHTFLRDFGNFGRTIKVLFRITGCFSKALGTCCAVPSRLCWVQMTTWMGQPLWSWGQTEGQEQIETSMTSMK